MMSEIEETFVAAETYDDPVPVPQKTLGVSSTGIFVKEVRVRNYRCLRSIDIELNWFTILMGQNNSGKTSFLNALFVAIGAGQHTISKDDIFLYKNEFSAPKSRSIVIDVLILPTNGKGETTDIFPEGSAWLELWGSGIVQDEDDQELVAIRTCFKWNELKGEYIIERKFLKDWKKDSSKWEDSKPLEGVSLSIQQIEPLALYLLDAKRDIAEDLRTRSSFWSKMVEEHGLAPENVERIEEQLSTINKDIVDNSDVFKHIQSHLKEFHETLSCDEDSIEIMPLARHLRDLSRGMDVVLSTHGAPPFPLHQQGMGTRSLGTFFTFWAFTTWRQKRSANEALHPMMALEEPETHLHPQAQRALFRKIRSMPGQRIVSTHSPYICGQAEVAHIRHFSKSGEETIICRIDIGDGESQLKDEDLRKIDRQVMNTRGDILFARVIVFFEGETEEQALPDFAEKHWGKHPNDLSYSFIGVGGHGGYLPFLRMADGFKIPWFIFSDGEAEAIEAINSALTTLGQELVPNNKRIIVLPEGKDFEAYITSGCSVESLQDLIAAIVQYEMKAPQHKEALEKQWADMDPEEQITCIQDKMRQNKTFYGSRIGKILPVPDMLGELFKKIHEELAVPKAEV